MQGRPRAGGAGRQHHDRPHLAGRLDQEGQPGRQVPDRARRRAAGLQLLRLAPRQPRGDGARHLRQRPPEEPAGPGHGGRRHAPPARRRADVDLRRLREVPEGGRAAADPGRQGVRLRLVARLGGQGAAAAGRAGRDRRELRAHPPQQPGRHGRPAVAVPAGRERRDAGPDRRGGVRPGGAAGAAGFGLRRRPRDHGAGQGRRRKTFQAVVRIDTPQEVRYYQHGGILQYVLRQLLGQK